MARTVIELVEIKKINPHIKIEVVYATKNNFTGQVIYTSSKCYLRKEVAQALSVVQKDLEKIGLGLKVWDGYRPMSAQQKLWESLAKKYPNEVEREYYVSNPKKGGRHTRGTAVDCTLIDLKTGKEVEMPTPFDHFGKEAWRDYNGRGLSAKAKKMREVLQSTMKKHGFEGIRTEWWHFDYKGWQQCASLTIELR